MKTEVHFRSTAFNCTERRDYFINEGCFGDDVARWIMAKLQEQGSPTAAEPAQEDFGWYLTFHVDALEHCLVIGFQPNDPASGDQWICWLERQKGFWGSIFGGRKRGISPEAVQIIDFVLQTSPLIHDIAWVEPGADVAAVP